MNRFRPRAAYFVIVSLFMLLPGTRSELHAQDVEALRRQAERVLGRPITNDEALRLLQQSGLSASEIQDLLVERGYDPGAADAFLSVLDGSEDELAGTATPIPLLEALTGSDLITSLAGDSLPADFVSALRHLEVLRLAEELETGPPIFGREIFMRATSEFRPRTGGPVPASYRVGPDDELILVLTGDAELAYRLIVAREGWVAIPDIGRMDVSGLTMTELRSRLVDRLSGVYSGLRQDGSGTMFLDLSLGSLHTNLVYVIGEVERPGVYEIGSFGTVLDALYPAGGPRREGSFREVRVNRGEQTRATVDIYEYLLEGRSTGDITLQDGDVVFVPVAQRRVEVAGAIVRPGIYELRDGEFLADIIRFAGGLTASAAAARVQIARILPPGEQAIGLNRVLLDVPLAGPDSDPEVSLVDGDRLTVFAVLDDIQNSVQVTGGVWRPGSYGVEPGLRLWDVLERAGGLLPDAFEGRAQIQRMQDNYTWRMIQVRLVRDAGGRLLDNPTIEPLDEIYVFARRDLREESAVSIGGWIRQPGVYPYVQGMTVRDLVLRAGGLRTGAFLGEVEISRVLIGQTRSDTITQTFALALDSTLVFDGLGDERAHVPDEVPDFTLRNLDAVYVRRSPGFEPHRRVVITGEVMFPGPYSTLTRDERIIDVIERAGGLTDEAYPEGLQLWRLRNELEERVLTGSEIVSQAFGDTATVEMPTADDSLSIRVRSAAAIDSDTSIARTRVGMDYVEALRNADSPHNLLVESSDSIYVPRFISTVDVQGAVQTPTKVLFTEGKSGDYYIQRAGGYLERADKGRARVQRANGEVLVRGGRFLFFGGGLPQADPGSVITVPFKPEKPPGPTSFEMITVLGGLLAATATVILAATR